MSAMASQIAGVSIVCSNFCSGEDQRAHQSSASLAFGRGIHRSPVNSPHKGPVMRKMFAFDGVIVDVSSAGPGSQDTLKYLQSVLIEIEIFCSKNTLLEKYQVANEFILLLRVTNCSVAFDRICHRLGLVYCITWCISNLAGDIWVPFTCGPI